MEIKKVYSVMIDGRIKKGARVIAQVNNISEFNEFRNANSDIEWNEASVAGFLRLEKHIEEVALMPDITGMRQYHDGELRQVLRVKIQCYKDMLSDRTSISDAIEMNNFDCELSAEQRADFNKAIYLMKQLDKWSRSNSNTALWDDELLDAMRNPQSVSGVIY